LARTATESRQIVQDFVDYLNGVINRTVSDSRLTAIRRTDTPTDRFLITRLVSGAEAPLLLDHHTTLLVQHDTEVNLESGRCETVTYTYRLERDGKWVIRWEFFRKPPKPSYEYPLSHVHVNTATPNCPTKEFSHLHVPTRRVPLEMIHWHAIVEWGVAGKAGWRAEIEKSIRGFEDRQTVR
jgi:hypothetical protein